MKRKVLLVVNQFYGGGAQRVVSNLSLALADDFDMHIVIYNDIQKVVYPFGGTMHTIKLPYSDDTANNPAHIRALRLIVLIYRLRKLKRKLDIDISVSFMEASNFANLLSRGKEQIIISIRTYLSAELQLIKKVKVFKLLIKLLYNKAERVIIPSKGLQTDLIENFSIKPLKTKVIYNFIDKGNVEIKSQQELDNEFYRQLFTVPVLINVGRLFASKGHIYLISVYHAVRQNVHSRLVIVGAGILRQNLIEEANKYGLRVYDEVELLSQGTLPGSVDDYDIFLLGAKENPFRYLSKSTVFVFTSIYEGFPNVIIEAMACGLPVISTDCNSGPREILLTPEEQSIPGDKQIDGSFGILMPEVAEAMATPDTFDPSTWSAPITRLLSDSQFRERYARASLTRAAHFERKVIIKEWKELLMVPTS